MKSSGKSKFLGSGTKKSLGPHSAVFSLHIMSTPFQMILSMRNLYKMTIKFDFGKKRFKNQKKKT